MVVVHHVRQGGVYNRSYGLIVGLEFCLLCLLVSLAKSKCNSETRIERLRSMTVAVIVIGVHTCSHSFRLMFDPTPNPLNPQVLEEPLPSHFLKVLFPFLSSIPFSSSSPFLNVSL